MEAGRLPRLQAMRHNGVSGELESVVPPVTGPAWTSFITGKNPGKHGVFEFKLMDRNTYQYHVIDPQSRRGQSLWDLIGRQGGRAVVLNLPIIYPPEKINGVMVSGFLTPSGRRDFVYPPEMLDEIEQTFGPYALYPPMPFFAATESDEDIEQFLQGITHQLDYQFRVAQYLAEKVNPHFLMLHIHGGDLIGHWLWHLVDQAHPHYDPAAAEKHGAVIFEYFRRFDEAVGKLADGAGEDTTFLIVSDHGNGTIHTAIDLNNWLLEQGYIALKDTPATRLKYRMWKMGFSLEALLRTRWLRARLGKLAKRIIKGGTESPLDPMRKGAGRVARLRLTYQDIDWPRTKAFCYASIFGQMIINVKGLWSQGCVSPGAEYHAIRDQLVRQLSQLRDPRTGQLVDGHLFLKDEVYHGPYMDDAPDITFVPLHRGYLAGGYRFISNKIFFPMPLMTGFHRMDGLLLGTGPALRSGATITGARIMDVCPTILYLMGLPIPKDVDGEVLTGMVAESFLKENAIELAEEGDAEEATAATLTAEEEADIIGRLQSLGYL
jgi:predicted AlkP superfamily phosphohydrolase/phosphomutase